MGNAKPRGAHRRESRRNGQERHTEEKTELLDDITEEVYRSEVFMDTVIYLMRKYSGAELPYPDGNIENILVPELEALPDEITAPCFP